jgi:ABC-type Mn2+/Zn2+ transport system permease subunit
MEFVSEPLGSDAVRQGMLAAAIVGALCGVIGTYVVLRGLALMADSLAHGVLPGIAVAFMLGAGASVESAGDVAVTLGALGAGLLTAGLTTAVLRRAQLRPDTAAAVVFVFMLALGVVLISAAGSDEHDLEQVLFGDVLGVSDGELILTAVVSVVVLAAVAVLYRPFLLLSFDPRRAAAAGLPVAALDLAMLAAVTVAVVVGFRVVGALLVLGMLIAPPAAAVMLTRRLPAAMALSAAIAALSAPAGLLVSSELDVAAGSSIVLVALSVFLVTLLVRPVPRP